MSFFFVFPTHSETNLNAILATVHRRSVPNLHSGRTRQYEPGVLSERYTDHCPASGGKLTRPRAVIAGAHFRRPHSRALIANTARPQVSITPVDACPLLTARLVSCRSHASPTTLHNHSQPTSSGRLLAKQPPPAEFARGPTHQEATRDLFIARSAAEAPPTPVQSLISIDISPFLNGQVCAFTQTSLTCHLCLQLCAGVKPPYCIDVKIPLIHCFLYRIVAQRSWNCIALLPTNFTIHHILCAIAQCIQILILSLKCQFVAG